MYTVAVYATLLVYDGGNAVTYIYTNIAVAILLQEQESNCDCNWDIWIYCHFDYLLSKLLRGNLCWRHI